MNYFDIFIIIIIFSTALISFFKGFLEIVFSFVSTIISLIIAISVSPILNNFIITKIGDFKAINILSIIVLFIISKLLFQILIHPIIDGLEEEGDETTFESVNKTIGFIIGLFEGIIISFLLIIIFDRFVRKIDFIQLNNLIDKSIFYKICNATIYKIPFINNLSGIGNNGIKA